MQEINGIRLDRDLVREENEEITSTVQTAPAVTCEEIFVRFSHSL